MNAVPDAGSGATEKVIRPFAELLSKRGKNWRARHWSERKKGQTEFVRVTFCCKQVIFRRFAFALVLLSVLEVISKIICV